MIVSMYTSTLLPMPDICNQSRLVVVTLWRVHSFLSLRRHHTQIPFRFLFAVDQQSVEVMRSITVLLQLQKPRTRLGPSRGWYEVGILNSDCDYDIAV